MAKGVAFAAHLNCGGFFDRDIAPASRRVRRCGPEKTVQLDDRQGRFREAGRLFRRLHLRAFPASVGWSVFFSPAPLHDLH
ncbi:MAG: hypothetical protein KY475_17905 [Planctomycetes bacterium]|nr:hypothetical protein [Planctomycetota bacterium]